MKMKIRSCIFWIIIFLMLLIGIARSTELAHDSHEFMLGIILGISSFVFGVMWFGMVTVAFGALIKSVWGGTKIYALFKKWISFSLILWFTVALILSLSMLFDPEKASFFFLQCVVSGIAVETWVYKYFLQEKIIENIKTNKHA